MPQLGQEIGQGQHQEGQAGVVVVLEGGSIDAHPGHPLEHEADRDQAQAQAAPLERLPGHEGDGRDLQPPGHQVAVVVDRGRGVPGEAGLVKPDRLEVERPGPERRRRRVGGPQVVVVVIHRAGELEQGLAGVARRPGIGDPVAQGNPGQVRQDVHRQGQDQQAQDQPGDRDPVTPAQAQPARRRLAGRLGPAERVVWIGCRGQRAHPERTGHLEQHEQADRHGHEDPGDLDRLELD